MKRIGKLTISQEKVIKKEELLNLKGGGYEHYVSCKDEGGNEICGGEVPECDETVCKDYCKDNCSCTTAYVCT